MSSPGRGNQSSGRERRNVGECPSRQGYNREHRNWDSHDVESYEGHSNLDNNKSDAQRIHKGYQEARRQDRDRRDRRNERINSVEVNRYDSSFNDLKPSDLYKENIVTVCDKEYVKKPTSNTNITNKRTEDTYKQNIDGTSLSSHKISGARPIFDDQKPCIKTSKLQLYAEASSSDKPEASQVEQCSQNILNLIQKEQSTNRDEEKDKLLEKDLKTKCRTVSDLEKQWQKEEEDRRDLEKAKKEEEMRILEEEETIRKENERKRMAEEELERVKQEELQTIEEFIVSTKDGITQKLSLRERNLNVSENYPDERFFSRLDSSLKKNTAFVKKVKNLTENQKDALTKDFYGLNLSKYIGEVATAITEAKLKMSDIGCALHLSSLVHQRYAEFSSAFLESWQKVLLTKKDDKVPNPSKLRVDLRFFADLIMCGIFSEKEGLPILANQLMLLTNNDKEEHNNLSIIISFCKHCGDDYAGFLPKKIRSTNEKFNRDIPRSKILTEDRKKGCCKLIKEYYTTLCTHLLSIHKELKSIEKQNRKILQTKGELSQDRKDKHETVMQSFVKLLQSTNTFADLIDEEVPRLPTEKIETEDEIMGIDIYSPDNEFVYDGENTLFEDEDTRQFYENLPDLKAIVPQILYKDSETAIKPEKNNEDETVKDDAEMNIEEFEKEIEKGNSTFDMSVEEDCLPELEDDDFDIATSMRQILDTFLNSLPTCVNRDLIDKAAIDFCMNLNTKANRKKLVKSLFTVHRTRYDLLPFYSRFIATLYPCMPDVDTDLVTFLKRDFKWHVRKKDQINIESKLKTVRFIGELTKFNMFPKTDCLHCIKMLLFDFSHHNIEMACALLESCGRYLYRSAESHHRTKIYLDVMIRKKTALHFDQRYSTLIENAFFYSNPPEAKTEEAIKRPTMHEYIRKLLYKDLSKITTEKILRQMRKLIWEDEEIVCYATKCLTAVWNVRYNVIHCCANLLAGLAPYHEKVAIHVVDGVIEEMRLGMEVNHPKYNQRRISTVKYLGELYNYRLVESSVIFKMLYSFITFDVVLDDDTSSLADPPEHLFRIRLVCTILDTCGQYFDRGSSKKKLDCFLLYFQRYYWYKRKNEVWTTERPFPLEMEYSYQDTLEILRPKLILAKNFDEATNTVAELEEEFRAKLAEILPSKNVDNNYDITIEDLDESLSTIQENEEIDELSQNMSQMLSTNTLPSQSQSQESEDDCHGPSISDSQSQHMEVDDGEENYNEVGKEHDENSDYDDECKDSDSDTNMSSDDDVNVLTGGPKVIKCVEDDDFMSSFDKMLTDSLQNRMHESTKVPTLDIAVPIHVKSQKVKCEEEDEDEFDSAMKFVLMTRKGNKQQFSNLNVPVTEKFATEYKEREQAEKKEKERMKRVVLNIHERQEEEDYQDLVASMNRPVGPHLAKREPKPRPYQHPKGAPDVDLIFGSKKW